jgi:capsular exopolysaccharide synthesis family protein
MTNPLDANAPSGGSSSINFRVFYTQILRRLWLIILCFAVAIGLALIYVLTATPRFASTAVLQVQKQQQRVYTAQDSDKGGDQDATGDDEEIKTIEQDLQLDSLFERVVADPVLLADKDFLPGLMQTDKPMTQHDIAMKLKKYTTIKLRHNTRLIDVTVEHPDPTTAQLLTSTLVTEFIAQNGSSQTNTDKMAMTFLEGQAARFKTDLQKAQDALQVYGEALLLKDRITDERKVVDDLSQRYRAKHPKLIQARAELLDLDNRFDTSINAAIANSPAEAAYWSASVKAIPGESFEDHIDNELKFVEARTNVLQSEGDTQSALFDNVLKQMREADVSKEIAPITVNIVQPAPLPDPDKPASPRKVLILGLAGLAGLVIGFGAVFVLDGLDSSIKTVDEATQLLNLPILGLMPLVKKLSSKKAAGKPGTKANKVDDLAGVFVSKSIVLVNDPEGLAAENFRSLRASIALLGKEKDHRVFLFSSAMTSEGKTFTSCNFAVSLAQQGLKTLLIDADLRLPAVYQHFNLSEKKMGLIEHVSLGVELDDVIQSNVVENLDILLPGVKCPSPAEFLSGDGLKDVIQQCLLKYDRIVLDTAPINVVSDTLLIAPYVQSVCLVVRLRQTPRSAIQRALTLLEMTRVKPVGVVLNGVPIDWKAAGYSKPGQSMADHNYGRAYVKT